jgi:predicted transcriptional regulator
VSDILADRAYEREQKLNKEVKKLKARIKELEEEKKKNGL